MRKILLLLFVLFVTTTAKSQNSLGKTDDLGRIALSVYIPEQVEGLPEISKDFLASKLSQIISESGIGSSSIGNRFIVTPKVSITN